MLLLSLSLLLELYFQLSALFILIYGGNWLCKKLFFRTGEQSQNDNNGRGRWIGGIERILIFIGAYTANWDLITGVVALKALARFKQLDEKDFSEYFLIGSLFSILYAIVFSYIYTKNLGFFTMETSTNLATEILSWF